MTNLTIIQTIIVALIPMAQLYARVVWLKGSLDKMWTLIPIFMFPPFSLVPALMMKFGWIKDGPGGKPYDHFMWIPIISKFMLAAFVPKILELFSEDPSDIAILFSSLFIQLLINMIPNLVRRGNNCNSISFNSFGKAFVDGTIANGIGELIPFILGWVPFVGIFLSIIGMIPVIGDFVDSIIWTLGYSLAYIFINMMNADKMQSYCDTGFLGRMLSDKIAFFVLLILTILIKVFNEYSPI